MFNACEGFLYLGLHETSEEHDSITYLDMVDEMGYFFICVEAQDGKGIRMKATLVEHEGGT
jgi:hypothetical protein